MEEILNWTIKTMGIIGCYLAVTNRIIKTKSIIDNCNRILNDSRNLYMEANRELTPAITKKEHDKKSKKILSKFESIFTDIDKNTVEYKSYTSEEIVNDIHNIKLLLGDVLCFLIEDKNKNLFYRINDGKYNLYEFMHNSYKILELKKKIELSPNERFDDEKSAILHYEFYKDNEIDYHQEAVDNYKKLLIEIDHEIKTVIIKVNLPYIITWKENIWKEKFKSFSVSILKSMATRIY